MYYDGCTAGPLSDWLNRTVETCCDAHDSALDHTFDLNTFIQGNWDLLACVTAHGHPILALAMFIAVSGPVGLYLYFFGKKKVEKDLASR